MVVYQCMVHKNRIIRKRGGMHPTAYSYFPPCPDCGNNTAVFVIK